MQRDSAAALSREHASAEGRALVRLHRTLVRMAQTFVGCCGWSEAQARYVVDFPAIELRTTFYQPPPIGVVKRWKSLAPPDFRFCLKAWQLITHTPSSPTYRRLKSEISVTERDLYGSFRPTEQVWRAWERTREVAEVLQGRTLLCFNARSPSCQHVRIHWQSDTSVFRPGTFFTWCAFTR